MKICIFLHLYYEDTFDDIFKSLEPLIKRYKCKIYVNVCIESPEHSVLLKNIPKVYNGIKILKSPNKGKDIGGKLLLINKYITSNEKSDFMIFLHDKKSPQLIDGGIWRDSLFSIINPANFEKIENKFANPKIGMIGGKGHLVNLKNELRSEIFMGNEDRIIALASKYNLHSKRFDFISGTMFWVRSQIFQKFFSVNNALEIRKTLEYGNVMDNYGATNTHSWERLFGWIVESQNYYIKEI